MIRGGSDMESGTSAWTTFVRRNGIPFSVIKKGTNKKGLDLSCEWRERDSREGRGARPVGEGRGGIIEKGGETDKMYCGCG